MKLQSPNDFKKINESVDDLFIDNKEELKNMIADIIHNNIEMREVPYSGDGNGGSPDMEINYSTIEKAAKELANIFKSKKEIIGIIREAFDNHISSSAYESALGLESSIEGKEDFYKDLENNL